MSAYNTGDFAKAAISSVLNQTYSNIELVIVDNGSNSETSEILRSYEPDSRYHLIALEKNINPHRARQLAYEHSSGDLIMTMDSDDVLDLSFIEKMVSFLEGNELNACKCKAQLIDEKGNLLEEPKERIYDQTFLLKEDQDYSRFLNMRYAGWSCLYRKEFLLRHNYRFDYEKELGFFVYLFYDDCKCGFCDEAIYFYRQRTNSVSRSYHNAASFNASAINSELVLFDLDNNISSPLKKRFLSMFLVKSQLPICLYRYAGDPSYKINKDIRAMKKHYHYSFFKMASCYRYFSHRTKKIALLVMFHGIWATKIYIRKKAHVN